MASMRRSHGVGLLYGFALTVINIICLYTTVLDAAHVGIIKRPEVSKASETNDNVTEVPLTLVERAASTGAVCLDGSLPAYRFDRGSGSGANNWLLHFQGGGWCNDTNSCTQRKTTFLGSSVYMDKTAIFYGILSGKPSENPDFYNWNRVNLLYCDGASFAGDVEEKVSDLYFRGERIWHAMIDDLLAKGMDKAEKGVLKNLPKACISSQSDPAQCFFPQYVLPYIQTPIFILNSAYDTWQINHIFTQDDYNGHWNYCKQNPLNCTSSQLEILQGYRMEMLNALENSKRCETRGMFINSCFLHCQSEYQETWFSSNSTMINNKTIAQAVGDWYFDRSIVKEVDCPYPCDKTCPEPMIF